MENRTVNKPNRKKGMLALLTLAVLCLSVLAGGTYAYFTVEETSYNVITMGVLDMDLVEETTGGAPWPEEGLSGMMPGMVADKKAYISNVGGVDFYTRVKVEKIVTLADGVTADVNLDHLVLDINTTEWTEQDGWYYFNGSLPAGESTAPLFTTVTFAPDMGNEYQNSTVQINVYAQAVQSRNNGESALTASGWPAETTVITPEETPAV